MLAVHRRTVAFHKFIWFSDRHTTTKYLDLLSFLIRTCVGVLSVNLIENKWIRWLQMTGAESMVDLEQSLEWVVNKLLTDDHPLISSQLTYRLSLEGTIPRCPPKSPLLTIEEIWVGMYGGNPSCFHTSKSACSAIASLELQSLMLKCIVSGQPWTYALNCPMHIREVHMYCAKLAKCPGIY